MLAFYKRGSGNQLQYYYLHDYQGSLYAQHAFTTIWGRGARGGRKVEHSFESSGEMDKKIRDIVRRRIREGYRLFYAYPMINHYHSFYNHILNHILEKRAG